MTAAATSERAGILGGPIVALIPVRSLSGAKTRLGEPLDPEEREALVLGFLGQAIAAALGARNVAAAFVVSEDPALLEAASAAGATPLLQHSTGLNEGLSEARLALAGFAGDTSAPWAPRGGPGDAAGPGATAAGALLVLPVDLPSLTSAELDRLLEVAARAAAGPADRATALVALVPDRHGTGTNALLLAPPDAIEFHFGEGSRAAHAAAAVAAGAAYVELDGPLTFDVDTPEDLLLADLAGLGHESGR